MRLFVVSIALTKFSLDIDALVIVRCGLQFGLRLTKMHSLAMCTLEIRKGCLYSGNFSALASLLNIPYRTKLQS